MYYLSAEKCLLVSTFLEGLIFGGCNLVVTMLSAYGWILQQSGPYPNKSGTELLRRLSQGHLDGCDAYERGMRYVIAVRSQTTA